MKKGKDINSVPSYAPIPLILIKAELYRRTAYN